MASCILARSYYRRVSSGAMMQFLRRMRQLKDYDFDRLPRPTYTPPRKRSPNREKPVE